jgi:hypothetical protein
VESESKLITPDYESFKPRSLRNFLLIIYAIGVGIAWLSFIITQLHWPENDNSLLPEYIAISDRVVGFSAVVWLALGLGHILRSPPLRTDWRIWLIVIANLGAIYLPLSDFFRNSNWDLLQILK